MLRAGGTVTSILREAFQAWDQDSSGELNTKEFVGAIGRCGLQIDDATAHQLVNYYDRKGEQGRFGDGEIHYMDLVEELGKTCLHFMATAKANEFHVRDSASNVNRFLNLNFGKMASSRRRDALAMIVRASTRLVTRSCHTGPLEARCCRNADAGQAARGPDS